MDLSFLDTKQMHILSLHISKVQPAAELSRRLEQRTIQTSDESRSAPCHFVFHCQNVQPQLEP